MFTWNFQYVSKNKLNETFKQLKLNAHQGDILIRIHTAIHHEDEAVDLAQFIKKTVPGAVIVGTSTSAVISWGKLMQNQCVISVTWMSGASVCSASIPFLDPDTGLPVPEDDLCGRVRDKVIKEDTKLLLAFMTKKYRSVYPFISRCNDLFPGIKMAGGIVNISDFIFDKSTKTGFVFDENGSSDSSLMIASISGPEVECMCSCATGTQVIGSDITVTDSFGPCILSLDGTDAAARYRFELGDDIVDHPEITGLFPYVYSDADDIPILVRFVENRSISDMFPEESGLYREDYDTHPDLDIHTPRDLLLFNHDIPKGSRLRKAIIYDRKIISDNRELFREVENFEKSETVFGYTSMMRSVIYSNCVKWELSTYQNSNMCGCATEGQIVYRDGKNMFANCSFAVSVIGEAYNTQEYNPYALANTDTLAADNRELYNYLMNVEHRLEMSTETAAAENLRSFVRDCGIKMMYSEEEDMPNASTMVMDIRLKHYDRICIIDVTDITAIQAVFPEYLINLTYNSYIRKCLSFAGEKHYRVYSLKNWQLAICTSSYMTALSRFISDMEKLQKEMFTASEEIISIVPLFCIIDDFTADNLQISYNTALVHMMDRNMQFYVYKANSVKLNIEAVRNKYSILNIINYAIDNDRVIPYFQGIHDNKHNRIHHYESLMRIEDETGKLYYPDSFLDVARSFGLLYDSISRIMITKVFNAFRNRVGVGVSINLSMRDIRNREMSALIFDFLSTAPHPENFVFEILESEDIDDYDDIVTFVYRIHSLGGRISIDDFGSGYSNLQHLSSINSDFIKIDGSIIRNCCEEQESENIIALISGWKQLSPRPIKIIAEYVENADIQRMLINYDIDYSQGFYFSKPSPHIRLAGNGELKS